MDVLAERMTGLSLAPATLILTMGVFADIFLLRKNIPQTETEDCKDCILDSLFTTAWLNLLFSWIYALLATIYYYVAVETGLPDDHLFAVSGGVFMISRIAMYFHFIVRNHVEQLHPDKSMFWCIVCSTAIATAAFTTVYAVVFWRRGMPGGIWLIFPDAIYSLYIIYLVWGYVSDMRSPRRISHDAKHVMVQHTVIFSAGIVISWIIVGFAGVFSPLGLIGAAFNSIFVDLLFKGNEEYYETWCCCYCHSCVWNRTETSSQHAVTSDTATNKSRSSREGMIEMPPGGKGTPLTARSSETAKEEEYVE